MNVVAVIVV